MNNTEFRALMWDHLVSSGIPQEVMTTLESNYRENISEYFQAPEYNVYYPAPFVHIMFDFQQPNRNRRPQHVDIFKKIMIKEPDNFGKRYNSSHERFLLDYYLLPCSSQHRITAAHENNQGLYLMTRPFALPEEIIAQGGGANRSFVDIMKLRFRGLTTLKYINLNANKTITACKLVCTCRAKFFDKKTIDPIGENNIYDMTENLYNAYLPVFIEMDSLVRDKNSKVSDSTPLLNAFVYTHSLMRHDLWVKYLQLIDRGLSEGNKVLECLNVLLADNDFTRRTECAIYTVLHALYLLNNGLSISSPNSLICKSGKYLINWR